MRLIALSGRASELVGFIPSLEELLAPPAKLSEPLISNFSAPAPAASTPVTGAHPVKLDADGEELAEDSTEHSVLLLPHAGLYIDVRALHRGNHASCEAYARKSTLLGRSWRLPTVAELFINVSDRTRFDPARDPNLYPKLKAEWVWASDADADPSSPSFAWGVYLHRGGAGIFNRNSGGLALPVCVAGQS